MPAGVVWVAGRWDRAYVGCEAGEDGGFDVGPFEVGGGDAMDAGQ